MKIRIMILISVMLVCVLSVGVAGYAASEDNKSTEEMPEKPGPLAIPAPGYELLGEWYCSHDGVPVCLELKEDGVYTLTIAGKESEGTWEFTDGNIVFDGDEEAYMPVIKGERIMWAEAGEIFKREEVKAWEPAPVAEENVEITDFDGYWVSQYVESEGQRLPSTVIGDNSELFIDGGRVAMGGSLFGDIICDFTYEDASLSYKNSAARVVLQLQEDYSLRCTVTGEDAELIIYMTYEDFTSLPLFTTQEPEE